LDRAEGAFPNRARVYKLEEAISKRLYFRSKGRVKAIGRRVFLSSLRPFVQLPPRGSESRFGGEVGFAAGIMSGTLA
jgi:hypothetical protein